MEAASIFNSVLALVFVLCLIGLLSFVLKKYGNGIAISNNKGKRRLQVKEVLNIDAKKKLVIVARDDVEHLIAFNESKIEVIERDIGNGQ